MSEAFPFADDPYARLGVSRTNSMDDIERQAKGLIKEYLQKAQQANTQAETERFEQAYNNIENAYVEIQSVKAETDESRRALVATVEPETVRLNEKVTITVEDDKENPVPGCDLVIEGRLKGVTDDDGKSTVKMDSAGIVTIDVKKDPAAGVAYNDTRVQLLVEDDSL